MNEPQDTQKKDWHGASRLIHWHVQITQAQKDALHNHCLVYHKSEGKFVREAVQYLLGFYGSLEQEHPQPKGESDDKKEL